MSTEPVHPLIRPDQPEPKPPPPEPTTPTVSSGLPPTKPNPFGSAGGFPPQKPEPPDPTIKATKSGEIKSFSDKELLEIHHIRWYFLFSDKDLLEIHQIRWDLVKIYSKFDRSSQILTKSKPIRRNIGTGGEISEPGAKPETEPTPTRNPMDPNWVIRQLKRVSFGFDFYPPKKFGLVPGQEQTRPMDTPNFILP